MYTFNCDIISSNSASLLTASLNNLPLGVKEGLLLPLFNVVLPKAATLDLIEYIQYIEYRHI
jgi:hypothetical protein